MVKYSTEMIDKFLLNEFTSGPLSEKDTLQSNEYNEVYRVANNIDKNYVLRISKQATEGDIKFESIILDNLNGNAIPVACIIKTNSNQDYLPMSDNRIATLFTWIEGISPVVSTASPINPEVIYKAGAMLAKIHATKLPMNITGLKKRTIYTEIDRLTSLKRPFVYRFEDAEKFIDECNNAIKSTHNKSYPQVLLHNDYRPQNIIMWNDKVVGVIDLDWSCLGPAIKDLAHSLIEWSFPDGSEGFNMSGLESFLKGYNSVSSYKYELNEEMKLWMNFSALCDAATYFADSLEEMTAKDINKRPLRSYMYTKAKKSLEL